MKPVCQRISSIPMFRSGTVPPSKTFLLHTWKIGRQLLRSLHTVADNVRQHSRQGSSERISEN